MKIIKVIYKDTDSNEDFTFNQSYLAKQPKEGVLTVLNDKALIVEKPLSAFELLVERVNQ